MKKNNFIKALGVGAVATLGLVTMTGCSISTEGNADLIKILEESNLRLENTVNSLRDQNNLLEDCLQEFKNSSISEDEAWNKLLIAKAKFETNYNGERNNLRVIQSFDNGECIIECYKSKNNGYVTNFINNFQFEDGQHKNSAIYYENDGAVYTYQKDYTNNTYTKIVREDAFSAEVYAPIEAALGQQEFFDKEKSDIVDVEILQNGNFKISVTHTLTEESGDDLHDSYSRSLYLTTYEITKDDIIISMEVNYVNDFRNYQEDEGGEVLQYKEGFETESGRVVSEYSVLTETYMNTILQEAINKELKAE